MPLCVPTKENDQNEVSLNFNSLAAIAQEYSELSTCLPLNLIESMII